MSRGMKQAGVSARGIFWLLTLCALAGVACSAGGGGMVPDAHPVDAYEVSLDLPAGCPPEAGNEKGVGKPCTVGGNECPNNGTLQCTCDTFQIGNPFPAHKSRDRGDCPRSAANASRADVRSINRRRNQPVGERFYGHHQFDATAGAERMAKLTLGAADAHLLGVLAKHSLDRLRFGLIA